MRFLVYLASATVAFLLTLTVIDLALRTWLPQLPRFEDNFSEAYLSRTLRPERIDNSIVVLGDSVLWGYRLSPDAIATTLLKRRGFHVVNLAFEGGSSVNTYAMLRIMAERRTRPHLVVFNVNLKTFNAQDSAYRTLYPELQQLVWPLLSHGERALLSPPQPATRDSIVSGAIGERWLLYGMRSDIRSFMWNHPDAITALQDAVGSASGRKARTDAAHRPTADRFLGTYDLSPLTESNVQVIFLKKTADLLRKQRIPALAILTPTNHRLLHEYIDVPEYEHQLDYVRLALGPNLTVLNFDGSFPPGDFLDNDHLTATGNGKLADLLAPALAK